MLFGQQRLYGLIFVFVDSKRTSLDRVQDGSIKHLGDRSGALLVFAV
jgi:hypothetical protein